MPLNVVGRRKMLCVRSTRTRTESLSTTGASIGADPANSTHVKPPAAAPANTAEALRKSRRFMTYPPSINVGGCYVTSDRRELQPLVGGRSMLLGDVHAQRADAGNVH